MKINKIYLDQTIESKEFNKRASIYRSNENKIIKSSGDSIISIYLKDKDFDRCIEKLEKVSSFTTWDEEYYKENEEDEILIDIGIAYEGDVYDSKIVRCVNAVPPNYMKFCKVIDYMIENFQSLFKN